MSAGGRPFVFLSRSARIDAFLDAAAAAELAPADAVRLAVERELVLRDAGECGVGREAARHLLGITARAARARRPLSSEQAGYVRVLALRRRGGAARASRSLEVPLPERLYVRSGGAVPSTALTESALAEAVTWELAAALEGRTMTEWALLALAASSGRRGA